MSAQNPTRSKYPIVGSIVNLSISRSFPLIPTVDCAATIFVKDIIFPIAAPVNCNANMSATGYPIDTAAAACNSPNSKLDTVPLPAINAPKAPMNGDI